MVFWARWKAFRWRSGSSSSSRRAPRSCSSLHAVLVERMTGPARTSWAARVALVATGVCLSLAIAEIAVRAHVGSRPVSFHIVNGVFGQYDREFGQRFPPSSKKVLSLVSDGRVTWCSGVIASSNVDGLGGRSTLADARNADYVIFTTGDSFSYWMQSALTIPDVVETLLGERTGLKVVNLNFARGAYGI